MFKIIKKAFLLLLFYSSFVFPMHQFGRVALVQTLGQSAPFRNSFAKRCPIFWAGSIHQAIEKIAEVEVQTEKQTNEAIDETVNQAFETNHQDSASSNNLNNHDSDPNNQNISYVKIGDNVYGISIDSNTGERILCCCLNSNNLESIAFNKSHAIDLVQRNSFLHGEVVAPDLQIQMRTDNLNAQAASQNSQSNQHLSKIAYNAQVKTIVENLVAQENSELSADIENLQTTVESRTLQFDQTSKFVKDRASWSNDEFKIEKDKHVQELFQSEKKLELLNKNPYVVAYFNEARNGSDASLLYDFTKNLSLQDKLDLKEALKLEVAIKTETAIIQAIDCKIKQEAQDFTKNLEKQSLEQLQTKTIPDLAAQKETTQKDITSNQRIFEKNQKILNNSQDQQNKLNNSSCLGKVWRMFTRDDTETIVANNTQTLQAKQDQRKAIIQFLKSNLAKYNEQIDQAQTIAEKKEQFATQEPQQVQEQKNQFSEEQSEQKQEAQFLQEQAQGQYDQLNFETEHCSDLILEQQYHDRQDALSLTQEQGYASYDQEYFLSPQAAAYLQQHGIDYLQVHTFKGTALQQQFHSEICDIFEQAAAKQSQLCYQSNLLKQCVLCADAAYDANQLGQIKTVVALNNLGFTLLEYSQSVITASLKGCENLAYAISNLDETAVSVGKGLYRVIETLALNNDYGEAYISRPLSTSHLHQLRDQCNAENAEALKNLSQTIANLNGPERVEAVVQFAVEWYGTGKIPNVIGGILGGAEFAAAKGASSVTAEINASKFAQNMAAIAGESAQGGEVYDIAKTAQKLAAIGEEKIAQSFAKELTDAAKYILFNADQCFAEFENIGGVIPVDNKAFKSQFQTILTQLEQKLKDPNLEQVKKLYGKSIIDNKEILVDLDHICNFELGFKKSNKAGGYILDVGGGHLPEVCEALEQTGLVKIISTDPLPSGGIHYVMENAFTGKPIYKTIFPEGWTAEKVAQAALDVYTNDSAISVSKNGKFTKSSIVDGCEVKIYWESSNNNDKIIDKIVTCLPVKE